MANEWPRTCYFQRPDVRRSLSTEATVEFGDVNDWVFRVTLCTGLLARKYMFAITQPGAGFRVRSFGRTRRRVKS